MSNGYSEGTHDSPTGQDRLIRVGGKYNPTDPGVASGDDVFLRLDADGHVMISTGPREVTIQASTQVIANTNGADITNRAAKGAQFILDVSAASGTSPVLRIQLQAKDSISGNYVDIPDALFADQVAVGIDTLTVYPGVNNSANESISEVLPRTYRISVVVSGTSPDFTFSISASYIP